MRSGGAQDDRAGWRGLQKKLSRFKRVPLIFTSLRRGSRSVFGLACEAFGVELEEAGEDVLIGDFFIRNYGPAVGGEDGVVERAVSVLEPGGVFVIEVGKGARLSANLKENSFGVAVNRHPQRIS